MARRRKPKKLILPKPTRTCEACRRLVRDLYLGNDDRWKCGSCTGPDKRPQWKAA